MGCSQGTTFMGFRRHSRRPGVRNLPVVFPLDASLSRLVELGSTNTGAVRVPVHDALSYLRSPFTLRVVADFLSNPNVGHVVLVASTSSRDVAEAITGDLRRLDVPTETLYAEDCSSVAGFIQSIHDACAGATAGCATVDRISFPVSELLVGTECGGSDGYSGLSANPVVGKVVDRLVSEGGAALLCELPEAIGAEHLLAQRAIDAETANRVTGAVLAWESLAARFGEDLRGAQPSPGNQDGGLTTIEEKSLGAIAKGGSTPLVEVVDYGQAPSRAGLIVMDTPGHDVEQMTGMAAAGAQIILFTTGRGTPTGSPVVPTLKIGTNPSVSQHLSSLIDFDASTVLSGESLDDAGAALFRLMLKTASGTPSLAERASQFDFALPPLGSSKLLSGSAR
ncbi:MAG TPA: UxaA family hydrolase [Tepidiformaceae bacterium]|nr:UxaA family hydrolase [Tepidiformaceae bacterium]